MTYRAQSYVASLVLAFGLMPLGAPIVHATAPADAVERAPAIETFAEVHDRAVAAYMLGKLDEALSDFNRALALDPHSALAFYNRGNVKYALKDKAGAISDFSDAIKLREDFGLAYMNRGSALSDLWRLDEALGDFNLAVRYEPANPEVYYNRAVVHMKRGDVSNSVSDYEQLLKLDRTMSDDKAGARLQLLLRQENSDYVPDDPARLTTELDHGRKVEYFLALLQRSCLNRGSNASALAELAGDERWKTVPSARLKQEPNSDKLLGAWMFQFLESSYYVVQSAPNERQIVCSMSTMPINDHLLNDLKLGLVNRFDAQLSTEVFEKDVAETRYTLPQEKAGNPLDVRLVYRKGVRFVTVRALHIEP